MLIQASGWAGRRGTQVSMDVPSPEARSDIHFAAHILDARLSVYWQGQERLVQ